MRLRLRVLLALVLCIGGSVAMAADQCPSTRARQSDPEVAVRIAAVACEESVRWRRPFIDTSGRLAGSVVWEGEGTGLLDGGAPWRQVAGYWQATGLLARMAYKPGAGECMYAANGNHPGLGCRAFVIDNPWSAAFVSWVMQRAGVPGFSTSGSHYDYVRAARVDPARSPYMFLSPDAATPAVGDLLCYVRGNRVHGHAGLVAAIDGGASGLPMHCDIVVAANPRGDRKAYLVGGNVLQAVTMRILELDASGHFWGLPRRSDGEVECAPETPAACNANRQDWAALLKLKPQAQLAQLGPVDPPARLPAMPSARTCCVRCVVGSGVPRCPAPGSVGAQPPRPYDSD